MLNTPHTPASTLADDFRTFMIDNGTASPSKEQFLQMRRAFYAGAVAALSLRTRGSADRTLDEIDEFIVKLKRGEV